MALQQLQKLQTQQPASWVHRHDIGIIGMYRCTYKQGQLNLSAVAASVIFTFKKSQLRLSIRDFYFCQTSVLDKTS